MTDKKWSYAPAVIAVALVIVNRLFAGGSMRGFLILLVVVWALVAVLWLFNYWMKDRAIRFLLRLDAEERQVALAEIGDGEVEREIKQGLDEEPITEGTDRVERFSFPRRMSRDLTVMYLFGTVVALGAAVLAALAPSPDLRLTAAAAALVAAITTITWGWRRSRILASAIEISPFAISQVWPDGTRYTMLWRDVWCLRNRPGLGLVEVLGADRRTGIHLHYDRVAFKRAVELVLQYGGFQPPAAPQG